jgi:predicted nuclease with TOPRIM domain
MYLTSLKGIRMDYSALRNKPVYQDRWNDLHRRLDILDDEITREIMRGTATRTPVYEDRIVTLQRDFDAARMRHRLSPHEEREFQARLDALRRDAARLRESGGSTRYQEREDLSRRLDALAEDIERFR